MKDGKEQAPKSKLEAISRKGKTFVCGILGKKYLFLTSHQYNVGKMKHSSNIF